jgi:catechol 2,3-dioxygenase-like lactoylglutathione lyase family enzyme
MSGAPKGGFAKLVPELHVNDLAASLSFWRDGCGFAIAYQRDEEGFVFLELGGAQIMLCQRHGRYETGSMNPPLGQGAMFQIYVESLERVLANLKAIEWPLYEEVKEKWYRVGDSENGVRQFLVQDPDGYLVLFGQNIGSRPLPGEA